jgi:hypothetical protein
VSHYGFFLKIACNGLRAKEGRETNVLNCKPNTNLKEKYELSNYSKTSGFILHAVSGWQNPSVKLHFHFTSRSCSWGQPT